MADLVNSARILLRATYAPIRPHPEKARGPGRALVKLSFVAGLRARPDELARLERTHDLDPHTVSAIESVAKADGGSILDRAPLFAGVEWESLVSAAESLARLRERDLEEAREAHAAIEGAREARDEAKPGGKTGRAGSAGPQRFVGRAAVRPSVAGADLASVADLAARYDLRAEDVRRAMAASGRPPTAEALAATYEHLAGLRLLQTYNIIAAMQQQAATEPVGLLHLERLSFVPAGIEPGELVHSVPLAPGEEVNISHKEWSHTSEEFSRIVTDYMEAYSEEGVTEKSELSQSTTSQEQHSSGLNTGVTASGGYGSVTLTSSLSATATASASQSEQDARHHSQTTTRKASSRSKKEHKFSFKVASAAGTEDQQVRKIKNPFADRATRVDYYQLVRKWRVDLHRYGLRLTYDLMIPEPGWGVASKIEEIQDIRTALELGFGDPKAPEGSFAAFNLTPGHITRENLEELVARYGASGVAAPPLAVQPTMRMVLNPGFMAENAEETKHRLLRGDTIEIPEGYVVTRAEVVEFWSQAWEGHADLAWCEIAYPDPDPPHPKVPPPPLKLPSLIGASGKLDVIVRHQYCETFLCVVEVDAELSAAAFASWRLKAWQDIRDAAQARYDEHRSRLKERLVRLEEALGAQDPLSLRKIEREEVMKGVLRWLLGPGFDFAPDLVPANFLPLSESANLPEQGLAAAFMGFLMSTVQAHGEKIKFLHHAIEWENMIYFLYPYFWAHPDRWEFKKALDHPDLLHHAFLKAGSARVVITIRPGFEKAFLSFAETGKDDVEHDYLTIAEEMRAYAQTNYPSIRAANPVEDARPLLSPCQRKAWADMQRIMALLDEYRDEHGAYPTTEQGLAALTPLGDVPAADPWNNPFSYTCPGGVNDYELVSHGADGAPGGEGEAADITSWSEANLIGRWYEYTPTSALAIKFDEDTPTEA